MSFVVARTVVSPSSLSASLLAAGGFEGAFAFALVVVVGAAVAGGALVVVVRRAVVGR